MEYGIKKVKKLKLAKSFKEILHPGEPEYKKEQMIKKQGIILSADIVKDLNELGDLVGVKSPFLVFRCKFSSKFSKYCSGR